MHQILMENVYDTNLSKAEYQKVRNNLRNILHSSEFCGICLESNNLVHLDDGLSTGLELNSTSTKYILKQLFGDQVYSNIISDYICEQCSKKLMQVHLFVQTFSNTTAILHSYFTQMDQQIDSVSKMLNETKKKDLECIFIVIQDKLSCNNVEEDVLDNKSNINNYNSDASFEEIDDKSKIQELLIEKKNYTFICEYCKKVYTNKVGMIKHLRQKHDMEINYKDACSECKTIKCVHERYLESIKVQRVNGAKYFKCVDCNYIGSSRVHMIFHANKDHLNRYPYSCEVCNQTFHSRKKQKYHIRQYHRQHLTCQYCDEKFSDQTDLIHHDQQCRDVQRNHRCVTCPASFHTNSQLQEHAKKHQTYLPCDFCLKKFKNETFLQRHKIHAHSRDKDGIKKESEKDARARPCSICPAVLYSLSELREHLSSHDPLARHKCLPCKKEFLTRKLYNIHVSSWTHMKKVDPNIQFNFKCEFCDYSCKSQLFIENHKNTFHLKIKPYICNVCSRRFTTPMNLKYHMDRHQRVKKFQCSECIKLFTSSSGLKKHVLRHHTAEKPFNCKMCPKGFVCKSEYDLHILRNHSEKNVSCPLCETKFHTIANLKGHIRKVHYNGKDWDEIFKTEDVSKEFYEMFRDHRLNF